MKPVMQTTFGEKGNCYSACLASLFEIPLADVPNFSEIAGYDNRERWWTAVFDWLWPRGFGVIVLEATKTNLEGLQGWLIVSGKSRRGFTHATIWRNGCMVYDPHPDQTGIITPEEIDLLYLFDPRMLIDCRKRAICPRCGGAMRPGKVIVPHTSGEGVTVSASPGPAKLADYFKCEACGNSTSI